MSFEQDVYNRYCEKIAALAEKVADRISMDPNDPSNRGSAYTNRLQDLAARTRNTFANIGNNQQAPAQKPSPYMSQQEYQTQYGGGQTQKSTPKAKAKPKAKSSKSNKSSAKPAPKQQNTTGAGAGAVGVQTPTIVAKDQRPQISVNPGLPGMPPVNLPKEVTPSATPDLGNIGNILRSGVMNNPNETFIGPARRAYNEDGSLFYDPETGYVPQAQSNNGPSITPSMDAMIPGVFSASPAPQPVAPVQQVAPEQDSQLSGSLSAYMNPEVALYGNHDTYNDDRFRALAETGM